MLLAAQDCATPRLGPSQVADQECQLTGAELPDRICEKHGSFSKGAKQRAPDDRAEPLPKTVPPPDCWLFGSEMVPPPDCGRLMIWLTNLSA